MEEYKDEMCDRVNYNEIQHRQVTSQRSIVGSFEQGVIDFNFSVGGSYGFIPSKSYLRVGLRLTNGAGADPPQGKIAFADNPCAGLFTNCYFRAGGQDISAVINYAPQADMVKKRIQKSGAWLNTIGKDAYGLNASLADRTLKASGRAAVGGPPAIPEADPTDTVVYYLWQPPIGIMDCDKPLGAGDYRLQLNPNANYKTSIVEGTAVEGGGNDQYRVVVDSLEFYAAMCRVDMVKQVDRLTLWEHQVQSKVVVAGENNLDFTVPTSTKFISIFAQGTSAGTTAVLPPTKFTSQVDNDEKTLRSIQLSYANTVKPTTRWTSEFDAANKVTRLQQRYVDSKLACGLLWNDGGAESYADWLERGILLHYDFERDSDDRASQVQVQVDFGTVGDSMNLFIVAHYTRVAEMTVDRGFITSVVTQTA